MIIQILLIASLSACIIYVLAHKRRPKLIGNLILVTCICAIFLVIAPDLSNSIAHFVGVGRGSDLVIYLWIVISFALIVALQLKILSLHRELTEVARQLAIISARQPEGELPED